MPQTFPVKKNRRPRKAQIVTPRFGDWIWGPRNRRLARAAALVDILETRQLLSATWFVSPTGSDQNPGTYAKPFEHIQTAANVARPGDHVEIRAGVYHESVAPQYSGTATAPIIFEAYNGESVTLTGASPVTNWTHLTGDIYQTTLPADLGFGNNQVFVDGAAINEARWPNTSLDLSHPTLESAPSVAISGHTATIFDPALTQAANFWKGATIHIAQGQAWVAHTGTVIASAPGQITFTYESSSVYEVPAAGNSYYLTGTFNALGGDGEFYCDSTAGTLYATMPDGGSPASHQVQMKDQLVLFNVSGKAYITLQNLSFFAGTILTDGNSTQTVINHISAEYIGQFLGTSNGWIVPNGTGITLEGDNSLLENSMIAFCAGNGVVVTGQNSRVTNNVIHDVDYCGSDGAAVNMAGLGIEIDHNTIYNSGPRRHPLRRRESAELLYNTIHDVGLQTTEAGGVYTEGTDGLGTEIAFNQIYNMRGGGFGHTALFLDNYSSDYDVHNNRVWNVDDDVKLNFICRGNAIHDNTLDASNHSVYSDFRGDWKGTVFSNNVFGAVARFGVGAVATHNSATPAAGYGAGTFSSGTSGVAGVDPTLISVGVDTGDQGRSTPGGTTVGTTGGSTTPPTVPPKGGGSTPPTTPPTTPPSTTPPSTGGATPPTTVPPTTTPPQTPPPVTTPPSSGGTTTPPATVPPTSGSTTPPPATVPPTTVPPTTVPPTTVPPTSVPPTAGGTTTVSPTNTPAPGVTSPGATGTDSSTPPPTGPTIPSGGTVSSAPPTVGSPSAPTPADADPLTAGE